MHPRQLCGLKVCCPPVSSYKKPVPFPTERVPTVEVFLREIGRGCSTYADKFTSWKDLFQASSEQMEERGLPTVVRKYILKWTENFRLGKEPVEHPMHPNQMKKKKFPIFR